MKSAMLGIEDIFSNSVVFLAITILYLIPQHSYDSQEHS